MTSPHRVTWFSPERPVEGNTIYVRPDAPDDSGDTFDPTPDQIVAGIEKALANRELEVIPGLLMMLAVRDPRRAQDILDTIEIARAARS